MNLKRIFFLLFLTIGVFACTSDFEEINTNPNAITGDQASAKYFLTGIQVRLIAPDRYPYWRAHLIHVDRYAGFFTFGFNGCWWNDGLGYSYSGSYTDAAYGWLGGYFGRLNPYLLQTAEGGDFENPYYYAVGLIMKSLYYQQFTDVFGEVSYSEAGNLDNLTPKFDEQRVIYEGIIADLDEAMNLIKDADRAGDGIDDMGPNDVFFGGDLQKWKKFANALKLRVALRAYGAPGADFASAAITEALASPLPADEGDNCILQKDVDISQWANAAYGDIWHNFGGKGSKWTVGEQLVNYLRDYNDPRLDKYCTMAEGGTFTFDKPDTDEQAVFEKRVNFIGSVLENAGADYTLEISGPSATITLAENAHYIGQPSRLNGDIRSLVRWEFFSKPAPEIVARKNTGDPMFDEIILTTAEAYFLRAEAANAGFSGDANALFQSGIRYAMKLYDVDDAAIDDYLATSDLAVLNGSEEDNHEKISIQRWIALYTDGFEGWSVVRKSGYPSVLAAGVSDFDIFASGDITGGGYPQRMRYGSGLYSNNEASLNEALARQGADLQGTKLWWAKD